MDYGEAAEKARAKVAQQMAAMGIVAPAPPPPTSKPKAAPKKRSRPVEVKAEEDAGPVRRSSRRSDFGLNEEEKKKQAELREAEAEEEAKAATEAREKLNKAKHDVRPVAAFDSVTNSGVTDTLVAKLQAIAKEKVEPASPSKESERPSPRKKTKKATPEDREVELFGERLQELDLRSIVKVVPNRIYSLVVHPSTTKDLVFAGDKNGYIGLWDCTRASKTSRVISSSEPHDETWGEFWSWEAHPGHSVAELKISPVLPGKVWSSSYDCTVRVLDFETGKGEEVIDGELLPDEDGKLQVVRDESLIGGLDLSQDARTIWASCNGGRIYRRDMRAPKDTTDVWQIDVDKVGSFSLNPANENYAVTAHKRRDMRVWDLRLLNSTKSSRLDSNDNVDKACVASFEHGKACSAAYFDPTGTRILSTSYDNFLRVWDFDTVKLFGGDGAKKAKAFQPTTSTYHDNQTGRYVSVFKARWSPSLDPVANFTCGGMKRTLDVFSYDGTLQRSFGDPEAVTAVPAVTAAHPTLPYKYFGGNASGKLSYFGVPVAE